MRKEREEKEKRRRGEEKKRDNETVTGRSRAGQLFIDNIIPFHPFMLQPL